MAATSFTVTRILGQRGDQRVVEARTSTGARVTITGHRNQFAEPGLYVGHVMPMPADATDLKADLLAMPDLTRTTDHN